MMTIKGFKFAPVAWMTMTLGVLTAVEAVNETLRLLPSSWTPYLVGAITVLTAVLGRLAYDRVTPTAAPKDDAGNALVPKWAAGDTNTPPSSRGGGIGGAGMHSW